MSNAVTFIVLINKVKLLFVAANFQFAYSLALFIGQELEKGELAL